MGKKGRKHYKAGLISFNYGRPLHVFGRPQMCLSWNGAAQNYIDAWVQEPHSRGFVPPRASIGRPQCSATSSFQDKQYYHVRPPSCSQDHSQLAGYYCKLRNINLVVQPTYCMDYRQLELQWTSTQYI